MSTTTTTAPKNQTAVDMTDASGAYVRSASSWRSHVTKGGEFEPESGRYHLYVSYACPWAHRCLIMRKLKGLEAVISLSVVHYTWGKTRPNDKSDKHTGWIFKNADDAAIPSSTGRGAFDCDGVIPDPHHGVKTMRELYDIAGINSGVYSVPVLWDTKTKTIVNNESSEIVRILNSEFDEFATNPSLDLYPMDLRAPINAVNEWVYSNINNGVYKCGFAKTQAAYDTAVDALFAHLDKAEALLSTQRYLAGNALTEADIRLWVTLMRFDEVYVVYFKTNKKMIREYPNLRNYVRDVFQYKNLSEAATPTVFKHAKFHYYSSHPALNYYAVIPHGSNTYADFSKPHDRAQFK